MTSTAPPVPGFGRHADGIVNMLSVSARAALCVCWLNALLLSMLFISLFRAVVHAIYLVVLYV